MSIHANTGNQYALKARRRSVNLNQRVYPADRKRWDKAAKRAGLTRSQWIEQVLNKAALQG